MADLVLYRFFDADGSLLYIGMSSNVWRRFSQHRRDGSDFIPDATVMTMERGFVSRAELCEAEAAAIRAEKPRFNVTHNRISVKEARIAAKIEAQSARYEAAWKRLSDSFAAVQKWAEASPENMRELWEFVESTRPKSTPRW